MEWTICLSQENRDGCFRPAEWKLETLSQPSSSRRLWFLLKGEEINKGMNKHVSKEKNRRQRKGLGEHKELFTLPRKQNMVASELNKMFVCSVIFLLNQIVFLESMDIFVNALCKRKTVH